MRIESIVSEVVGRHIEAREFSELLGYVLLITQIPANPLPVYRLADALQRLGDYDGWQRLSESAMQLEHRTRQQQYYRARAKIRMGEWSGWTDYEARHHMPRVAQSTLVRQLAWEHEPWDGSEAHHLKLLVVAEQGFGDMIQMLRFIPELAGQAKRVILAVPASLASLAQHNYGGIVTVISYNKPITEPFDRYLWTMSLPAIVGYLPAFRAMSAPSPVEWVSGDHRLRVGLCWAGRASYSKDVERSVPLRAFEPLLVRDDFNWFSLQVGDSTRDAHEYPNLKQPPSPLQSFVDTANLISSLDCVVSVDTAVCHLAASLAIPTVLLLNTAAVWRWGLGESTPWYPTMSLERQQKFGEWSSVIRRTIARLEAMLKAGQRARAAN